MTITVQKETYSDVLSQEILPLAQKCWDEETERKGTNCAYHEFRNVTIEPDFEMYKALSERDVLVIFTVRDGAALIGYAVAMIYYSYHHRKILTANGDSIYVQPEHRVHAVLLLERIIKELKLIGASTVNWIVSPNSPMYEVLQALGFVGDEIVMEKLLCALQ